MRARPRPRKGRAGRPVRDARLQRPLVLAAAGGAGGVHGHDRGRRHRRRPGAPLPGQLRGDRAGARLVALRPRPGHLRAGRQLPARRRGRLHPRVVAARPRRGPPRRRRPGAAGEGGRDRRELRALGRAAGRRACTPMCWPSRRRSMSTGGCCRSTCGVRGARAHARAPGADPGRDRRDRICAALAAAVEIEPDATDEDVHSAIERLAGATWAPWVHAGRSRNDQVQTAMRLWVKDACDRLAEGCAGWRSRCSTSPSATARRSCPATPTASGRSRCWLGHHLAAHVWALRRDLGGSRTVRARADV